MKTTGEILELREKAREIIENKINMFGMLWEQVKEMRPYLAVEFLIKIEQLEEEVKENDNNETEKAFVKEEYQIIIDLKDLSEERIGFIETQTSDCNDCQLSLEECNTQKKEIITIIDKGNKAIKKFWQNNPPLRSCIANTILEQIENGLL